VRKVVIAYFLTAANVLTRCRLSPPRVLLFAKIEAQLQCVVSKESAPLPATKSTRFLGDMPTGTRSFTIDSFMQQLVPTFVVFLDPFGRSGSPRGGDKCRKDVVNDGEHVDQADRRSNLDDAIDPLQM
jgi:hypothetical protein